jgi:hypothetical protein
MSTPKKPTTRSATPKKKPAPGLVKQSRQEYRERQTKDLIKMGYALNKTIKKWQKTKGEYTDTLDLVELDSVPQEHWNKCCKDLMIDFKKKTTPIKQPKGKGIESNQSKYTPELFEKICEEIATSSKSTRSICVANGITSQAMYRWLEQDAELRDKYVRAKEEQVEFMVDEMLEIADDGTNDYMTIEKGDKQYNVEDREVTNRSRLRIDTRKFIASKLKPKKYGDKLDVEHTIIVEQPLFPEEPNK